MKIADILTESDPFNQWSKDDALAQAGIAAKRRYEQLIADLEKVEAKTKLYLVDSNVDAENVEDGGLTDRNSQEYWNAMYSSACMNAGIRAEKAGQGINDLLGKKIY